RERRSLDRRHRREERCLRLGERCLPDGELPVVQLLRRRRGPVRGPGRRSDLLLVCSCGGHLLQLVALRPVWEQYERTWVTFDKSDARSLLAGEEVVHAFGPTNRNV